MIVVLWCVDSVEKCAVTCPQACKSKVQREVNCKQRVQHHRFEQRELQATIRMAIIIAFFCCMWLGFFTVYVLHGWCPDSCPVPRELDAFLFWLGYSNSSVNPILYTIFNADFRKSFQKILRCYNVKKVKNINGNYRKRRPTVNAEHIIAKNEKQITTTGTVTAKNETTTMPEKTGTSNPLLINNNTNQSTSSVVISNTGDVVNAASNPLLITTSTFSKIKTYSPFAQTADDVIAVKFNDKNTAAVNNDYAITDADLNNDNRTAENSFLTRLLFPDLQKAMAEKKSASLNKRYLPNIFLPDCPSVEKNAAGNKTYFEVYAGPDFAFQNLSDTGNSAYLQKRKEKRALNFPLRTVLVYATPKYLTMA